MEGFFGQQYRLKYGWKITGIEGKKLLGFFRALLLNLSVQHRMQYWRRFSTPKAQIFPGISPESFRPTSHGILEALFYPEASIFFRAYLMDLPVPYPSNIACYTAGVFPAWSLKFFRAKAQLN